MRQPGNSEAAYPFFLIHPPPGGFRSTPHFVTGNIPFLGQIVWFLRRVGCDEPQGSSRATPYPRTVLFVFLASCSVPSYLVN